jgi:hypothetical protein
MKLLFCAPLFLLLFGCGSTSALMSGCPADAPQAGIAVATNDAGRPDYPASNTIDGDPNTFMTTDPLVIGQTVTSEFILAAPTNLSCIQFQNDYSDGYAMGDMTVEVSADGVSWNSVSALNALNNPFAGTQGEMAVSGSGITRIRLSMTYNGSGAFGATPSFYLSEFKVYGEQ